MSKRLQVMMDERELREIRKVASQEHVTVAEWVRQALRAAYRREPTTNAEKKLAVVRVAAQRTFPTADIGQMLVEIDSG